MRWNVLVVDDVARWYEKLALTEPETADHIHDAVELLAAEGPGLGRPLVDTVRGTARRDMKELRPRPDGGSGVRILFVVDPTRHTLTLVAGDKVGG